MSTTKNPFSVRRLVINAVLIALYVALGYLRIPIGNSFRITIAPFAVILCALAFGPADGLIVGLLGEFLTQVLGPYGLTPTTLLWCIGETARGLSLGLLAWAFLKKWLLSNTPMTALRVVIVLACCMVTGILSSLGTTFALYVDSKLLGYYTYAMVFGALAMRLVLSVITSGLLGYISIAIIAALRKSKLL